MVSMGYSDACPRPRHLLLLEKIYPLVSFSAETLVGGGRGAEPCPLLSLCLPPFPTPHSTGTDLAPPAPPPEPPALPSAGANAPFSFLATRKCCPCGAWPSSWSSPPSPYSRPCASVACMGTGKGTPWWVGVGTPKTPGPTGILQLIAPVSALPPLPGGSLTNLALSLGLSFPSECEHGHPP